MRTFAIARIASLVVAVAACGSSPHGSTPMPATTRASLQMTVRGEALLEPAAVSRFYAARDGQLAWTRRGAIDEVVRAIADIAKDGLTPADYHQRAIATLIRARDRAHGSRPALDADLDLLATDAVAALLDHVRYGRVRPVELDPRWNVDPRDGAPPLERLVATVAKADSPRAAIDAAKPRHFIYRGLVGALADLREIERAGGWPRVPAGRAIEPGMRDARVAVLRRRLGVSGGRSTVYDPSLVAAVKRFQGQHRLEPTGVVDAATIAELGVSAADRADQVRVNLERARWVVHDLDDNFILVNLPAYKAYLIRGGKNVWETRTMIGQEARQSPTFRATLRSLVFNPDWTVPPTILAEDVIGGMRRGNHVLDRRGLVVVDADQRVVDPATIDWQAASADAFPYTVRQPAGPTNVLGRVKFEFPNPHAIYMHDTPAKQLFDQDDRATSSGCIRIERPLELAARLLGWTPAAVNAAVDAGETRRVQLAHPLPILIVYWTVSVAAGADGEIRYARDVYGLDAPLLAALERRPQAAAAQ